MQPVSLEEIIRRYISLPPTKSGTGWYPILCKVCNDHGRKGPRGGFKFDDNKVAYHCFNCGHSAVYDPSTSNGMPQKMVQVLNDFGVPESEWKQALLTNLQLRFSEGGASSAKIVHRTDIEPAIIPLPDYFYFLKHASPNDKWAKIARYYLEDRAVDPESYPFMLAEHTGDPKQDVWFGRVIIPIYKESNLIFYIGRDLTEKKAKKYLSPSYSKEKIIYGFDRLFQNLEEPLYIVEGWFDAHVVNGIAILGNEISEAQEIWLNKSPRQKVYIPDRSGNGKNAALRALDLGWSIATPAKESWASDVKDINDAVKRYGLMYVLRSLAETTATGFAARANLELYCKYEEPNKNRSKKKDYHSS